MVYKVVLASRKPGRDRIEFTAEIDSSSQQLQSSNFAEIRPAINKYCEESEISISDLLFEGYFLKSVEQGSETVDWTPRPEELDGPHL